MARYKNGIIKVFGRTSFPRLENKHNGRVGKAVKIFSLYGNQDLPLWVCDIMYEDTNEVVYTQKPEDWLILEN